MPEEFVKLTELGTIRNKQLELDSFKKFIYWFIVGNVTGALSGQFFMFTKIRGKKKFLMRYRIITYLSVTSLLTYHGYKLANRDLKKGRRDLIKIAENVNQII
ncbi:hypothetical protein pb186bvf_009162 [Paramecium bursaria]